MPLSVQSPFPEFAWPRVWQWIQPFLHRVHDDFSPKTVDEFVPWMQRRTAGQLTFGVYRDGELGGLIWFERGNGCSGLVHVVFKKQFWGSETTIPAMDEAANRYFETGAQKLNSMFFTDNHAVRAVVKRFGFRKEGCFRSTTERAGTPVDLEAWGILKEEFYGNRSSNTGADHRSVHLGRGGRAEQSQKNRHERTELHGGAEARAEPDGRDAGAQAPQPGESLAAQD